MTNDNDNNGSDDFAPIVRGLNAGGLLVEKNGDPVRSTTGGPATGGITARTPEGYDIPDFSELQPDSIIKLPGGLETSYAAALAANLIKPLTGQGQQQRQDDGMSPQQQQHEQRQDETQEQQELQSNTRLDDKSEEWLGQSITNSTEATVFAATDIIGNDGAITDDAVGNIAAANNIEPEEARERIAHVMTAMEKEAVVETAKSVGTSEALARQALQAARTENPSALREAAQRHFHDGKPRYERFVKDFVANLDQTDPNYILQANPIAGRKVHYSAEHRCVVVTTEDGSTYRWQDAVHLGLIGIK